NGTFVGKAINGPYQRDLAHQVPGGRLLIGLPGGFASAGGLINYRAPSINLAATAPTIVVDDNSALPDGMPLTLPTAYAESGGFTRTELYSNGFVTLQADAPLDLLPGSSVRITAQRVDVKSDISAPGGSIELTATDTSGIGGAPALPGIGIDSNVQLNVSGLWTNDSLLAPGTRPTSTIATGAGSITLAAVTTFLLPPAELQIGSGAQFHASG